MSYTESAFVNVLFPGNYVDQVLSEYFQESYKCRHIGCSISIADDDNRDIGIPPDCGGLIGNIDKNFMSEGKTPDWNSVKNIL